jgi:hypothetical protein
MPATPPKGSGPRLTEAMPRPLLIVFVAVGLVALVGTGFLVLNPPQRDEVALFERRPTPAAPLTHDTVSVEPVVPPVTQLPLEAPCPEVEGVDTVAGPNGVRRIGDILRQACRLSSGTDEDTAAAVRALSEVTIRFATFDRTGAESTLDRTARTIWLNVRFASIEIDVTHIVPLVLHEAAHLASAVDDAETELRARAVEVVACRHMVPAPAWPRWCEDAREITEMPREEALRALRAAGFP